MPATDVCMTPLLQHVSSMPDQAKKRLKNAQSSILCWWLREVIAADPGARRRTVMQQAKTLVVTEVAGHVTGPAPSP